MAWKRRCIISRPIFPTPASRASGFLKFCADACARQQPDQERVLSAAFRQLLHGARFPSRQQRDHHSGRFRHSARRLQPEEMAVLSVRPLCRSDRQIPRTYQRTYAELFRRAQPMDFGIGYRWRSHESNLLLSVRLPDDGSATADATSSTETAPPPPHRPRPRKPRPAPPPPPQPAPSHGFLWFQ